MRTHDRSLIALWHTAVTLFRNDHALITLDGRSATFAEVDTASDAIAGELCDRGLQPGETVTVTLRRGPAWLPVALGIWKAGGVFAPMAGLSDATRQDLTRRTGARVQIIDPSGDTGWLGAYAMDWQHADADSPADVVGRIGIGACHAYVMPTSGSSGRPKLALITHRTSAAVLSGLKHAVGIAPGERALHTASFSFSSSLRQLFLPLISGAAVTVLEHEGSFSPDLVLRVADGVGVTSLDLTPSQITGVLHVLDTHAEAPRPRALQRLLVASEVLTPALLARWRRAVAVRHHVFHLYGQTETGGAVSARALPDRSDADLTPLPLALPFAPFTPYFRAGPDGADEMFLDGFDAADGILTADGVDRSRYERTVSEADADDRPVYGTGDLFVRDPNGALFFRGRAEAEIKIRGRRVDTGVLERDVANAVAVDRVIVAAVPGAGDGTVLCIGYAAAATPASDQTDRTVEERILHAAAAHLDADLPRPRVVRLDHMPTTRSGKVDRPAVAELLRTTLIWRMADTEDPVERVWNTHTLGHRPPEADDAAHDFFATGGDSLTMIALLADVTRVCGVRVLPQQFHEEPTLAGLRRMIRAAPPVTRAPAPAPAPAPAHATRPRVTRAARPASAFQRGLWLSEQLAAAPVSPYWLPIDLEVAGALDPARVQHALRATVSRFDMLRAGFAADEDTLMLLPDAIDAGALEVQTLDGLAEPTLRDLGTLTTRPLVRLGIGTGDGRAVLALRVHHAVADRPSLELILAALCRFYDGDDETMPREAPSGFEAMASMEPEETSAARDEAQRFWLACLPAPVRRTTAAGPPSMARTRLTLEASSAGGTIARSTRHAAWLSAYHRALIEARVEMAGIIGVDIDVRPAGTSDLVGPFVNALPMVLNGASRESPDADAQAGSELQASAAIVQALAHAQVPIGDVVPPARRPTGHPRQPFFLYKLVYQKAAYPTLRIGGFPTHYVRLPTGIAEHDMTLFVREASGHIDLELAWNAAAIASSAAQAVLAATVSRITGRKALSA